MEVEVTAKIKQAGQEAHRVKRMTRKNWCLDLKGVRSQERSGLSSKRRQVRPGGGARAWAGVGRTDSALWGQWYLTS